MPTTPHAGMQAEFHDVTLYDPLQSETSSEEQLAHIRSQGHTPNPQQSFAIPPEEMDYARFASSAGARVGNHTDPQDLGRMDSGLSSISLGLRFDPETTPWALGDASLVDPTFESNNVNTAAEQLQSPLDPLSRKSSGLATVSEHSHLMSPTLTNDTAEFSSPGPRLSENAPYRQLGGGDASMSRESSLSTVNPSAFSYLHVTPAPTRSSAVTSPDPHMTDLQITSPEVRVVDVAHPDGISRIVHSPPAKAKRTLDQTYSSSQNLENASGNFYDEDAAYITANANATSSYGKSLPHIRTGMAPGSGRSEDVVSSINELSDTRKSEEKNKQVSSWLLTGDAGPGTYLDPNAALAGARGRVRSKSTSKNSQQLRTDALNSVQGRREALDRSTPGPDALIDEESGDEEDEDNGGDGDSGSYPESEPADVRGSFAPDERYAHSAFGHLELGGENQLQASPWVDAIYLPSKSDEPTQPATSNAAIMRWQMRNRERDIETASRAATWGTRRMSDSTLDQVFGSRGLFSRLKITTSREKEHETVSEDYHEARNSLQEGIDHMKQKYRAFRSNSVNRRKTSEPNVSHRAHDLTSPPKRSNTYMRPPSPGSGRPESPNLFHGRKESNGSFSHMLTRIPSKGRSGHSRPTTPRLDTGASTPKMPSIDTSSDGPSGPASPTSSGGGIRESFKRLREGLHRYRSDDSHGSSDTLAAMLQRSGGPPVAALTSPRPEEQKQLGEHIKTDSEEGEGEGQEDDEDDGATARPDDKPGNGVKMPMTPSKELIIPNLDGFKSNVRDVNPRLEHWLVDRLGQEQLRRYKRLVELKLQHVRHIQAGTCPSGEFCIARGGQPRYFAPPKSQQHKDSASTGDADVPLEDMDEDEQAIAEGTVTEAQFPAGLPMPPVQRLPAEFECPYCFTVKKFTKPSDWSKHVHEDLQPFTCTFKRCSDPKSFKRKADWVRHENERHRQLEWWECTEEGCQHRCYRRDNFVQHLIREHKLPEPASKPTKQPNKPAVRGPAKTKGRGRGNTTNINDVAPEDKVLLMVEICRHETAKNAVEERCRFCNNVCNSWKKLTVHLARHMEQLSIPVLELVKIREVNVDTIISPLEPRPPMQASVSPVDQNAPVDQNGNTGFGPANAYQSATAGSMPFSTGMMDPSAFVSMSDPTFNPTPYDASTWNTWTTPQAAGQLQYDGSTASGMYHEMAQGSYGAPADSSDASFMAQGGNGRPVFMPNVSAQQQTVYSAGMGNGSGFGHQARQPPQGSAHQYPQTSSWDGLQYDPSQGQQMSYAGVRHGGPRRQQNQAHPQSGEQQYYNAPWQQ